MHLSGDGLKKLGHDVEYAFAEDLKVPGPSKLHRFVAPFTILSYIQRRLKSKCFDIVEIHEPVGFAYAWARRRDKSLPKCVLFSYGLECFGRKTWLDYHQKRGLPVRLISRITSKLITIGSDWGINAADGIICSNQHDANFVQKKYPRPSLDVAVHFSGCPGNFVSSAPTDSVANRNKIIFLGTWITRKGILDLVEAFQRIFEEIPGVRITVAGTGKPEAEVRVDWPLRWQNRVDVRTEIRSDSDLQDLLLDHGIFILPSYFEGQPLALIESASLGLVPVASDIPGINDFITNNKSGILTKVGSPEDLATAIVKLINSPKLISHQSAEARLSACKQTWDLSAANLEGIYSRVINSH
jgi:glycosyltransferase involved in cell wall biosynthesis